MLTIDRFCYCCNLRKGIIAFGLCYGVCAVFLLAFLQTLDISNCGPRDSTEFAVAVVVRGGIAAGILEVAASFLIVYGVTEEKMDPVLFWQSSSMIILLLELILVPLYGILTGHAFAVLMALPVFLFKIYFVTAVYSYVKETKKKIAPQIKNDIRCISSNCEENTERQPPPAYSENI